MRGTIAHTRSEQCARQPGSPGAGIARQSGQLSAVKVVAATTPTATAKLS